MRRPCCCFSSIRLFLFFYAPDFGIPVKEQGQVMQSASSFLLRDRLLEGEEEECPTRLPATFSLSTAILPVATTRLACSGPEFGSSRLSLVKRVGGGDG